MNILANPLSIDMRKEFRERIIFKILRACYLAISKMREQEVDPECRESWVRVDMGSSIDVVTNL